VEVRSQGMLRRGMHCDCAPPAQLISLGPSQGMLRRAVHCDRFQGSGPAGYDIQRNERTMIESLFFALVTHLGTYPFAKYLLPRYKNPLAWMLVFGLISSSICAVSGFCQNGAEGALLGTLVGAAVGSIAGLPIGVVVWLVARILSSSGSRGGEEESVDRCEWDVQ
jgi:hypothetical protein